jgi:S1-C subfamily serine protease
LLIERQGKFGGATIMAGKWSLLVDGRVRLLSETELVELLEQDAISRYSRVKREPDGEWMPAERAVAKIRRRPPAQSKSAGENSTQFEIAVGRHRLWPWMACSLFAVALLACFGWLLRTQPSSLPPIAKEATEAPTTLSQPPTSLTPQTTTQPSTGSLSNATPATTESPAAQPPTPPTTVATTNPSPPATSESTLPQVELPSSAPYGVRDDAKRDRPETSDTQVSEFIASVEFERAADRAADRIKQFIDQYRLTQKQALQIGEVKRRFDDRLKKGLVRLGAKWVTRAEQEAAQSEAKSLIGQAFALTDVGSIKEAEQLLTKASALDGNNIEADLVLGMLNGIVYLPNANAKVAEASFETVLKRSPDHLGALNNAAVVEIRQKRYSQAIDHLARAAYLAPRCREVAQNLGRLRLLATEGRISLSELDRKRCSQAYSRTIGERKAVAMDPKCGYLLMLPYVSPAERSEDPASQNDDLVFVGYGTGFVLAPEIVLTNRHVVTMDDDLRSVADQVRLEAPSGRDIKKLSGSVKAICPTDDLAIVHIPGLAAPPLNLRTAQAELAEEIGILGFPRADQTGVDIKFVGGRVAGVNAERMLFDCASNQGNSGGPILSRRGDVVAVLSAVQFVGDEVRTQYGRGVPSPAAVKFAEAQVGSLPVVKAVPGEWPGIVSRVRGSIFKLDVYYKSTNPRILRSRIASTGVSDWLEDPSCPRCSGRGAVVCPGGCIRGDVQDIWVDQTVGTVLGRTVMVPQLKTNVRACDVCGGKGAVECPHCVKGIDPTLLQ